jgi:alkyl hydroperoxide reductase subunit D
MSIAEVIKSAPDAAKDIRLNFAKLLQSDAVSISQEDINAVMYAVGISLDQSDVMKQVTQLLEASLDEQTIHGAKVASAIMAMNNIYYRFVHLSESVELASMNPGLRMQGMMRHGIDKKLFEFMSLAISAVNGCGMCIQSHINTLEKEGADIEAIQMSAKIAAVLSAFNQVTLS